MGPRTKPRTQKEKKRSSHGQMGLLCSYDYDDLPANILYTGDPTREDAARSFLDAWALAPAASIDLETFDPATQAGALDPHKGRIRLLQVALPGHADLLVHDFDRAAHLDPLILTVLKQRLEDPSHLVVGHNLAFDLTWLHWHHGFRARNVGCTMILSQILWAGLGLPNGLADVASRTLGASMDKGDQRSDWGNPQLTVSQIQYAAEDTAIVLPLYKALMKTAQADKIGPAVIKAEMGCVPVYAEMNSWGMPLAPLPLVREARQRYQDAYDRNYADFQAEFPGCKLTESKGSGTRTGDDDLTQAVLLDLASLDVSLLAAIAARYGLTDIQGLAKGDLATLCDQPGVREIGLGRYLKQSLDYLDGLIAHHTGDSVRGGFTQVSRNGRGRSTSSGTSGSAPGVNLQNPPSSAKAPPRVKALGLPDLRSLFAVYALAMGAVDFSAAHGRIGAQTTGDRVFQESFNDTSQDPHCDVAQAIAAVGGLATATGASYTSAHILATYDDPAHPDSALSSRLRAIAKNCFYGWLNGAGYAKIADEVSAQGIPCGEPGSRSILDALKVKFPGIASFHASVKSYVKDASRFERVKFNSGSAQQLSIAIWGLDGRRIYMPVHDGDYGLGASPNAAFMALWMSVESTAKKSAMVAIRELSFEHPEWQLRIVNDCHDEVVWVGHEDHYAAIDEAVWLAMTGSLARFLPDVRAYKKPWKATPAKHSWAECK